MIKYKLIGCEKWMKAVGWPDSHKSYNCCMECHETLAHISSRTFKGYSYGVCCGVKALCLKNLVQIKYEYALNVTFAKAFTEVVVTTTNTA